jgi:DNA-binding protein H-NS
MAKKVGKRLDIGEMSTDDMWQLHVEIGRILSLRLRSEKRELEKRLAKLRRESELPRTDAEIRQKTQPVERRKYPRVLPKYQNPNEPSETWSGRGKQPRWLTAALKTGQTMEDFIIESVEPTENRARQQRPKQP